MSGSIKEKLLLYRAQTKHDPEAFAALYDLYVQRIYRFVYFKVSGREEAEDITSEVFLKTWDYIINSSDREIRSFTGLLYRIARNAVVDLYRARAAAPQTSLPEDYELGDGGKWYQDLARGLEAKEAVTALKKMKEEYREALTLRYVDELSVEEISAIMGKGQIAVRVTLHRAVKKLKELINDSEAGADKKK